MGGKCITRQLFILFILVCFLQTLEFCVGQVYDIDDSTGVGRQFDGIGGISGGGATSKLLVNYPMKQRDEILDYLFKPNFGASLHIFKVEIGGDSQSTEGCEASHMHEAWDENYHRGYEWWMLTEAKKRNPNIKIYALPWAFPGWVGNGTRNPYTYPNLTATYVLKWVQGAKKYYSVDVDYIGIWNERPYSTTYVKILRKTLDMNGFTHIKIVAADSLWSVANDILKDPAFAAVVDYIGVHYPGTVTTDKALETKKPLWSSEDYSTFNDNVGAGCWARILNQNYVNGFMTSTISWNLVASYYPHLPFANDGLMTADEPWSGHYEVSSPIWVTAHTTQFTEIGWTYLKHGAGVGKLYGGGSFVTLQSPDKKEMTLIIETMSHDHSECIRPALPPYTVKPQNATFKLQGSFKTVTVLNLWVTKLGFNGQPSTLFKQVGSVNVQNGSFTLFLEVDSLYTVTTSSAGQKGVYPAPPASQPFPLPYKEDFESFDDGSEPFYFTPQVGMFDILTVANKSTTTKVLKQVVLRAPIHWCPFLQTFPMTVVGDGTWTDLSVRADVQVPLVNATDGVFIAARVDRGGCETFAAKGIFFWLFPTDSFGNAKVFLTMDLARAILLGSGKYNMARTGNWNSLRLDIVGKAVKAFVDGHQVLSLMAPDKLPANGFAALGTDTFGIGYFDNFVVEAPQDTVLKYQVKHA
ncbi:galactocerebrosidase isoform X2 [Lingula anatina]|uniref:galactosylceramidase n=1 Tax=Lingula anatina TaxID=7574 RepID=A0A1S3IXV0_LINAN|nr:galactocerebrosidase isoform X2 [Lingula anatina]|eukprot:XP_013403027.1 galactocerebrosidase isoform X2 [Lingula anatina]